MLGDVLRTQNQLLYLRMKKVSKPKKEKGISSLTGNKVKVRYQFKFDKELIDELKKVADADHRPFNQYVEVTLKKHLAEVTGKALKF